VSVKEKAWQKTVSGKDQGDEQQRTIEEVSKNLGWRQNWSTWRSPGQAQREPAYCLGGVRHSDGMNLIQAFVWNVGCAGTSWRCLAGESPVRSKLSEQAGSESCGRHGNMGSEA
jgi:hypothetical protein